MKISSSHHRFGLWWLRYLCLCCLRDFFLPLAKTLPFWWVCRCLSLRLLCRRGSSHLRFWVFGDCATSGCLYLCCHHTNFLAFGRDPSLCESAIVFPLVCHAAVTLELVCVFFIHVAFRLLFYLWLRLFPSSDSAVCFSSAVQEGWQLPLFTFSSGCLFTFGWDFSLLVSLPLFISLVCCVERAWQRSLVLGVSLPPKGDDE